MKGPLPVPMPTTAEFWEGTSRDELLIPHCESCHGYYFYPRPFCPRCGSAEVDWKPSTGEATLVSYVINHRPLPPFDPAVPVIVALVELAEGVRMTSNIVGMEPDPARLTIGMALRLEFASRESFRLPVFTIKE